MCCPAFRRGRAGWCAQLTCTTPSGYGASVIVRLTVNGQVSNDFAWRYAAPAVTELFVASASAATCQTSGASGSGSLAVSRCNSAGGFALTIRGTNLGFEVGTPPLTVTIGESALCTGACVRCLPVCMRMHAYACSTCMRACVSYVCV